MNLLINRFCFIAVSCLFGNSASASTPTVVLPITDNVSFVAYGFSQKGNIYSDTAALVNTRPGLFMKDLKLTFKNIPQGTFLEGADYDQDGNPFIKIDTPKGILAYQGQAPFLLNWQGTSVRPVYQMVLSSTEVSASDTATLNVKVIKFPDDNEQLPSAVVGSGTAVYVNGVVRGTTESTGIAKVLVTKDETAVSAITPAGQGGNTLVSWNGQAINSATVTVADGKESFLDSKLILKQSKHRVISRELQDFNFYLLAGSSGNRIALKTLHRVELQDEAGETVEDLTESFTLGTEDTNSPNTSIICKNPLLVRRIFESMKGKVTFSVSAETNTAALLAENSFYLADKTLLGTVTPSPTQKDLPISGIRVVAKVDRTDLVFYAFTDSEGRFSFPDLPAELITLSAETKNNEINFYGDAQINLEKESSITLPMLSYDDITGPATIPSNSSLRRSRLKSNKVEAKSNIQGAVSSEGDLDTNFSIHSFEEAPVSFAKAFIAKGTKSVELFFFASYLVNAIEKNAAWSFDLFDDQKKRKVYSISRSLAAQKYGAFPPAIRMPDAEWDYWAMGGTTVDVSALTLDGPAILTGKLTVLGPLGQSVDLISGTPGLNINSATPRLPWGAHDKKYFSIPGSGKKNVHQRSFDVQITKSKDVEVTKVLVEAVNSVGDVIAADSQRGTTFNKVNANTINVNVTFDKFPSAFDTSYLSDDNKLSYRFTLEGATPDGKNVKNSYLAEGYKALWSFADQLPSYPRSGARDFGLDDWADAKTIRWINEHKDQLNPIDDISGEHSLNLGHQTHARGTDIDMGHFYTFPGASTTNGTSNYNQLVAAINKLPLMNSSIASEQQIGNNAKTKILAWVNASRNGIDRLSQLPNLTTIYYISYGPLPTGTTITGGEWGAVLLRTGKITLNGVTYDLGLSAWNNSKYVPLIGHYHHVHVTLKFDN